MTTPDQRSQFSLLTLFVFMAGAALTLGAYRLAGEVSALPAGAGLFHLGMMTLLIRLPRSGNLDREELVLLGWLAMAPYVPFGLQLLLLASGELVPEITSQSLGQGFTAFSFLIAPISIFFCLRAGKLVDSALVDCPALKIPVRLDAILMTLGTAVFLCGNCIR